MHYVYVLLSSSDNKLYVGYTNNLVARIKKHNAGKVRATKSRIPLKLIHYEAFIDEQDAKNRETYFKTGWGRRYLTQKLARTLIKAKI